MSCKIVLSWAEVYQAAQIGTFRRVSALQSGKIDAYGVKKLGWSENLEGAMGELAFAKYLNVFWAPRLNTYKTMPDVADYEIRTLSQHHYDLLIRPHELGKFVLVTGRAPEYLIHGWIDAEQAKQERWLTDLNNGRPAAYFVPQTYLTPFEDDRITV